MPVVEQCYVGPLGAHMKTLEQRLYEAFRSGNGLRLSPKDVDMLVSDDAIGCRISNAAAIEAGEDQPGDDCISGMRPRETWSKFVRGFKPVE